MTIDRLQVFISYSMNRSQKVAQELQWLLRRVVPSAEYWTAGDIPGGELWRKVIDDALASASFGISVVTPENRERPWLHFEAGAIAKRVGDRARLVPYLVGVQESAEIALEGPMKDYQARRASQGDTLALARDVASAAEGPDLDVVDDNFEAHWPRFEQRLDAILAEDPESAAPPLPTTEELASSVLRELRRLEGKVDALRELGHDAATPRAKGRTTLAAQRASERLIDLIWKTLDIEGIALESVRLEGLEPRETGPLRVDLELVNPPPVLGRSYTITTRWVGADTTEQLEANLRDVARIVTRSIRKKMRAALSDPPTDGRSVEPGE